MESDSEPKTPAERGAWPEPVGTMNFDEPVEVLVTLERSTYQWLADFVAGEGSSSFTPSVEGAIDTLIRAAKGELEFDWLQTMVFNVEDEDEN